jgi:hypothetical protein
VSAAKVKKLEEELAIANKLIEEKASIKLLTPAERRVWVDYYARAAEQVVSQGMYLLNKYPGADRPSCEMASWRRLVDGLRFFWQAQRIEDNKHKQRALVHRMLTCMRVIQTGLSLAIKQLEDELEKT